MLSTTHALFVIHMLSVQQEYAIVDKILADMLNHFLLPILCFIGDFDFPDV